MDISELVNSPIESKKRPHDDEPQSAEPNNDLGTASSTPLNPPLAADEPDSKRQRMGDEEAQLSPSGATGDRKDSGSGPGIVGQQPTPNGKGKGKDVDRGGGKKGKGGKGGGRNAVERKRVRNRNDESTEQGRPDRAEEDGREKEGGEGSGKRLAKRKVAMLLSFCGTGCSGMQFQHTGERTIEGLLFEAFVKAGAISKDNSDHPAKVDLQRAARTDAGVHAAGNVVSFKMIMEPPIPNPDLTPSDGIPTGSNEPPPTPMEESLTNLQPIEPDSQPPPATPEQVVSYINSFLPPQIRVWSFLRTRNTFNCRKECDSRRYEYLFPSWMLLPPKPGSSLAKQLEEARKEAGLPSNPVHTIWEGSVDEPAPPSDEERQQIVAADLQRKRLWRVDDATLNRFRSVLKEFEGTHCFHNYTVGREFSDRAAKRFMMEVSVRSVNVLEDGVQWVSVLFHGQSFMLHQRKMISMALMVCRTETPVSLIPETYGPRRITVPMAPALGLLLEQPLFGSYNDRVRSENAALDKQKVSDEEKANRRREEIDFSKHQKEIDEFKLKLIYERMREEEAKSNVFNRWIQLIDYYQGEDLAYLNAKGTIVQAAIIKKGERRQNALSQRKLKQDATGSSVNEDMEEIIEDEDETNGMKGKDLEEMEGIILSLFLHVLSMNLSKYPVMQVAVRRATGVMRASRHKALGTASDLPVIARCWPSQTSILPPQPLEIDPMARAGSSSQRRSPRNHFGYNQAHRRSDKSGGNANRRLANTAQHLMTQTDSPPRGDSPSSWHSRKDDDPNRKPDGSRFGDYAFFWKVDQPYGWASQWYWEPFEGPSRLEGGPPLRKREPPTKKFVSCEHFMMYHKAILFNDLEVADQIMEATRPIEVKDLGRQVSNFDEDTWVMRRYDIVLEGNKAKFSAIPEIREELLATGDKILVEASPFDKIYGIGFTWKEAMDNKDKWGLNVLGNVLMEVRTWLREQGEGSASGAN